MVYGIGFAMGFVIFVIYSLIRDSHIDRVDEGMYITLRVRVVDGLYQVQVNKNKVFTNWKSIRFPYNFKTISDATERMAEVSMEYQATRKKFLDKKKKEETELERKHEELSKYEKLSKGMMLDDVQKEIPEEFV